MPVAVSERVVEVIADLGQGAERRYQYGSGCIVRGRTVLTAAHVLAGAQAVQIRRLDKRLRAARVDRKFVGGGIGPDLALIDIDDEEISLDPIELGMVVRESPVAAPIEACHAVGYPWFAETPSPSAVRDTVDAWGHIPLLSKLAAGLLTVQVTSSPRPLPPERIALGESEWSGMSGAPVLASGCLLGVVCEHAPREGGSAITAVPLSALEFDPAHPGWGPGLKNANDWWARLGVPGLGGLRRFPVPEQRPRQAPRVMPGVHGTLHIPGGLPTMTVTMLGRRNSGKTTFTLGMYAVLAAGFKGFSLQAGTLNEELDIANSWNHLADDSLWPPGTRASQSYRMALKDGPTPVALIDWEDYRGGALFDLSEEPDAARLHERLHESDSVYVLVDGEALREYLKEGGIQRLGAHRISAILVNLFNHVRERARPLPSIVILVTKSDLLDDDPKAYRQDEIVRVIRELLPICFVPKITTLICPVTLGRFSPDFAADPHQFHKPILWSMLNFLQQQHVATLAAIESDRSSGPQSAVSRLRARSDREAALIERLGYALLGIMD